MELLEDVVSANPKLRASSCAYLIAVFLNILLAISRPRLCVAMILHGSNARQCLESTGMLLGSVEVVEDQRYTCR